jgi:signal transduction histidine kinase
VQVAEIFTHLERQFGPAARSKGLRFITEPSAHIVNTDPTLLRGMLSNLLSNAIRYTREGEVGLRATVKPDGTLSLAVEDTGIGIPSNELETIFQDFRRLEKGERMAREGFGLGLGIVRRLSSLLQFPVTVQSGVERGSVFRVEIPSAKVFSGA